MVSRLPVFSGKRVGTIVPSEMVGPLILLVVLSFALLIAYPWIMLSAATFAYLASLPVGWLSYRRYERRSSERMGQTSPEGVLPSPPIDDVVVPPREQADRQPRLH
jgi:CDP-diacylglycerol--serine O-phosphatidyltransferase